MVRPIAENTRWRYGSMYTLLDMAWPAMLHRVTCRVEIARHGRPLQCTLEGMW